MRFNKYINFGSRENAHHIANNLGDGPDHCPEMSGKHSMLSEYSLFLLDAQKPGVVVTPEGLF
jgi:hypothetical protein